MSTARQTSEALPQQWSLRVPEGYLRDPLRHMAYTTLNFMVIVKVSHQLKAYTLILGKMSQSMSVPCAKEDGDSSKKAQKKKEKPLG